MMEANQVTLGSIPFGDSKILDTDELRRLLYFALPIANRAPGTRMLWADWSQGRDLPSMLSVIADNGSTVIIVKVGEQIFGGFASAPWQPVHKAKTGSARCCLFSLTKDVVIPCKLALIPAGADRNTRAMIYHEVTPMQAYTPHEGTDGDAFLSFGGQDGDLVFSDDFRHCSSRIERSYGFNAFEPTSDIAGSLLAGTPIFTPDAFEVWHFVRE